MPTITFAKESDCDALSISTQRFWATQHDTLVTHGLRSFASGNTADASESLTAATNAARLTCLAKLASKRASLEQSLAEVEVTRMMLSAARSIAQSDYRTARDSLLDIADIAKNARLKVPEGQPVLLRTAYQGIVVDYFRKLDQALVNGTPMEKILATEKRACQEAIPKMDIGIPERCKKFGN